MLSKTKLEVVAAFDVLINQIPQFSPFLGLVTLVMLVLSKPNFDVGRGNMLTCKVIMHRMRERPLRS